jgi:hypothetical protein
MESGSTTLVEGSGGNVLLSSMRRMARLVGYCIDYEFEDVAAELTGADRVDLGGGPLLEFNRRLYKYTHGLSRSPGLARKAASLASPRSPLRRDYELFLPVFNTIYEVAALAALPDWRKRARVSACFISEVWQHESQRYLLDMLAGFDHIFLGVHHSVDYVARETGRPCTFLPLATDVLRFSPSEDFHARPIDVCNIGRRSAVTHAALLDCAMDRKFFYYYDTVAASGVDLKQRTFRVHDPREHRLLYASVLKRSRFFVTNTGFINDPTKTQGNDEISARFYEGAASGAVMIGTPPHTADFEHQFDWQDAVIRMPFDNLRVGEMIQDLSGDRQRLESIHRRNVCHAMRRHDWSHRLLVIFQTLDLAPSGALLDRVQALQDAATRLGVD